MKYDIYGVYTISAWLPKEGRKLTDFEFSPSYKTIITHKLENKLITVANYKL